MRRDFTNAQWPQLEGRILMLVTLSIVFCLASNPFDCQTVYPTPDDSMTGMSACIIRGQQLAAQWLDEHPKWMFDRIRCTPGNVPRGDEI